MRLHVTEYSPYARMTRILVREKKLLHRVEETLARTRQKDSPFYETNPSGRVPFLERPSGPGLEGSRLILEYLDQLDDAPLLKLPAAKEYWEYQRLEEAARGLMDGLSVWVRELRRPLNNRSNIVIEHEKERASRVIASWDAEIDDDLMHGTLNYPQLTLACSLCLDQWNNDFTWRDKHPKLLKWLESFETMPSFVATEPPTTISSNP